MTEQEHGSLVDLLHDFEKCPRLTPWEVKFMDDLRCNVMTYHEHTRISEKQWDVIRRIEQKVYA